MLVLSRRRNQRVLFPTLGIHVEVVAVSGKTVRLGIEAPREIRIVRAELDSPNTQDACPGTDWPTPASPIQSDQLKRTRLAIHLASHQIRQGNPDLAEQTLHQALRLLQPGDQAGPDSTIQDTDKISPDLSVSETAAPYKVDSSFNRRSVYGLAREDFAAYTVPMTGLH